MRDNFIFTKEIVNFKMKEYLCILQKKKELCAKIKSQFQESYSTFQHKGLIALSKFSLYKMYTHLDRVTPFIHLTTFHVLQPKYLKLLKCTGCV